MNKLLKRIVIVFLFGLLVGLSLNNNSNPEFHSKDNSITLVNSLRGGEKSDSNQFSNLNSNLKPAFVQTPPSQTSSRESGEQSINSQKMPPRFGYRTALSGGKKLPDNPDGGGSWDASNQDNEDWKNAQKDPEVWSKYQEYFQDQSKKSQQCDLIEIESKIKEDSRLVGFAEDAGKDKKIQRDLNGLIEQLRLGNESPGIGTKTLFKGVKEARARSGARVYFRKKNGKIEILAKSNKNPKDQKAVIKILRKKYG